MSNEFSKLTLAVDLDGTLIRSDLFVEGLIKRIFGAPWRTIEVISWLLRGRAWAKARIAEHTALDPASLPYNVEFVRWLQFERAKGRPMVLASAGDQTVVRAVAEHLGLFDGMHKPEVGEESPPTCGRLS